MDKTNIIKKRSITKEDNISIRELLSVDDKGKTLLDYIIENKIIIMDDELYEDIFKNYDVVNYMITHNYIDYNFFRKMGEKIDKLFDDSNGISLIEVLFNTDVIEYNLLEIHVDIIARMFEKKSGKYMIEKLLKQNEQKCIKIISNFPRFDILYSCLSDIKRLDLMKYANQECLLSITPNGNTMLEDLYEMGEEVETSRFDNRIAKILYNRKNYQSLLDLDCNILINYPSPQNNYLDLLIRQYKNGEPINFNTNFHSTTNEALASAYIILLKNGIVSETIMNNVICNDEDIDDKPPIIYMLEIDENLTLKHLDETKLISEFRKYLLKALRVTEQIPENIKISEFIRYLPNPKKFESKYEAKIPQNINYRDIFRSDLLKKMNNDMTVLEYALNNNVPINIEPKTANEIVLLAQNLFFFDEKLLYENLENDEKLIDYLIKNKYYDLVINNNFSDLRIIEYCIKYNCFEIVNDHILDILFIEYNEMFLAEKYLENENFIKRLYTYMDSLSPNKIIKLYKKGYKKIAVNAKESVLLKDNENGKTILEDMLESGLSPTFNNGMFRSSNTMEILYKHNRPDLMVNSTLELLMCNCQNTASNYLQYIIDCYKKGTNVTFEKKYNLKNANNRELLAKYYIQMAKNGLHEYLNELTDEDLISKDETGKSLIYYLIMIDKDITLNKLFAFKLKMSKRVANQIKLMGIDSEILKITCNEYDCRSIFIEHKNSEYYSAPNPLVEDLLAELKYLFLSDGESDKTLIDALVLSYRQCTSISQIFIEELRTLIYIKRRYPCFYYKRGKNEFLKNVYSEDENIITLQHETGHAMHWYLSNSAFPEEYADVLSNITADQNFISRVANYYFKRRYVATMNARKQAKKMISEHIIIVADNIEKSLAKTSQTHLDEAKVREEKKKVKENELKGTILDYMHISCIDDIVDAITNGDYLHGIKTDTGEEIVGFGHGKKYYSGSSEKENLRTKFQEMIANYITIIKSKNSEELIKILRNLVGDELVNMLEEFYKTKILNQSQQTQVKGSR